MKNNENKLPVLTLKKVVHRKNVVLAVFFTYNNGIKELIKGLGGYSFSQTLRAWHTEYSEERLDHLKALLHEKVIFIEAEGLQKIPKYELIKSKSLPIKALLNAEQRNHLNAFYKYLKGKRFSKSTLTTYSHLVAEYIVYKDKDTVDLRSIEKYSENVLAIRKTSISTHRQFISAMKHYLAFINSGIEIDFKALAPKKDRKLPNILSSEEIIELIRVTKNLKHRVCIALIYSSGLRIGELISLKLHNIDVNRKLLKVQNGKGRKDRYVPIANTIMPLLHNYITSYTPTTYLIEALVPGKQYSPESVRKFLKKSCELAKITKKITPHTLRHSYATHLLENGTDIRYIQELLGHTRPETTMIYTHVRSQDLQKITNPLDFIVKQLEQRKKID